MDRVRQIERRITRDSLQEKRHERRLVLLCEFAKHFSPIAEKFQMTWRLASSGSRPKMAILVSKYDHCLVDLDVDLEGLDRYLHTYVTTRV